MNRTRLDHARRSYLTRAAGAPSNANAHGIVVPLGPDRTPDRLDHGLRRLLGQLPHAPDAARVWHDDVPTPVADPAWRDRELRRPVDPDRPLRVVVGRHPDGRELVLVAHRALLHRAELTALATALATGDPVVFDHHPAPEPPDDARIAVRPLSLDWCGDGHADPGPVELGPGIDDATAFAALAVALARYENRTDLVIGTITSTGIALVPITVDEDRPAEDLVAEADAAMTRFAASWHGPRPDPAGPDGRLATVAVHLDTRADPADRYAPGPLADFPLTVHVTRSASGAVVARVLGDRDPRRFAAHFAHLARELAAHPRRPVADLRMLTEREERDIVALGDGGPPPPPDFATVPEGVAAWAVDRPDAVAVSSDGTDVTYRELDRAADRVAAALRARGVGPGTRVGVCLPRSAELVVVLLGVLKAGAAYVPMDPEHPADRLRHIAADADLTAIVAADPIPAGRDTPTLRPADLLDGGGTTAVPQRAGPDDPAYVIYTSGSTGRPKGVVVPHRNVVSLLAATRDRFAFGPDDTWTLFHSAAFDFSVWEIWGCLTTGGRLVVVPSLVARSPDEFADLLRRERVTVLNQTPTAFGQLAGADVRGLALRLVVFGGEPLDTRTLTGWFDRVPESACRLVNMFGITETTVHVTAEELGRRSALDASRSVGRPLPGWSVVVRDARGRVVPVGVPGEIVVGGAGVARGYHGRPDLTAQRFRDGAYRSGDLGRLRPDGGLDHLGRLDDQVSVRGHRVEPGEITAVLLEDPLVTAAAVTAEEHPEDGTRLHAFVVAPEGVDPLEVRRRAARTLPHYMLPATVTRVPRLPSTGNGKLDVAALRALPRAEPAPVPDHGGEGVVATVCRVLGGLVGTAVGPSDDFFELGGNSLLATKLSSRLRAEGLPALPVRQLYRGPTPLGVAAYYDELASAERAGTDRKGATD